MKKLLSEQMEFKSENQTYVTVTEETANLDYVSQAVQRKWGSHYVLVTSDGLKLDNSAQGIYVLRISCKIHCIISYCCTFYSFRNSGLPYVRGSSFLKLINFPQRFGD